ncbi:MAG: hypothetical protein PUP92_34025 [Rhizonema sp. PD38]|nr:hypothetical protein [Rhizonema sp. PD38]
MAIAYRERDHHEKYNQSIVGPFLFLSQHRAFIIRGVDRNSKSVDKKEPTLLGEAGRNHQTRFNQLWVSILKQFVQVQL